jgi:hypothetical protein
VPLEKAAIAREHRQPPGRGPRWATWGSALRLGEYERAIDLHAQALAIFRDIGDRYGEANADYLGRPGWPQQRAGGDAARQA